MKNAIFVLQFFGISTAVSQASLLVVFSLSHSPSLSLSPY
jgi:hypothetical protein